MVSPAMGDKTHNIMTHTLAILPLTQWLGTLQPDNTPRPDNTLIAWQDQQHFTLAHLRCDVLALTGQLMAQPGQRWALCFENSYLFIVALLSVLHAGKTPLIMGHCRAALLDEQQALFDGVLSEYALNCCSPLIEVRSLNQCASTPVSLPVIDAQHHVELFTSGSSGQPRRIVKTIACLENEAQLLAAHFADRLTGCRIVASVVPQHQYGLTFRVILPMALGLPLHASMLYYVEQLTALDAQYRYAFISSPAFLKRLDYQLTPPPVALILSAGGELPWQDVQHASTWFGCAIDEIYGSTETGVLARRYRVQARCPWQLFAGVRLRPECQPASPAPRWRAISPLIPQPEGILLDDELLLDQQGGFHLLGRRGRVVKIEEKRVSLDEVERRLLTMDDVTDAHALLINAGKRQSIAALLVLTDDAYRRWQSGNSKQHEFAWRRQLLPWLEPVAIPRYWRVLHSIPVNSMGKRIDQQLQELFSR